MLGGVSLAALGAVFCALLAYVLVEQVPGDCGCIRWRTATETGAEALTWRGSGPQRNNVTWLQSEGHITYGPVSMEPGPPGTRQATPRGTFHVQWRAGANYISTEYHVPIPYAVFFAPGGVAFHGGSLDTPSHGCVHLDIGSARYYHDHLPTGAEVVVF